MDRSQEFENLIKNLKDSIIISGLDGKLKYISPQYSELIGRDVTIGESFGKTMHPDDFKRVTKLFAQALKQGTALEEGEVEYRVKHKDGHYIWISTSTSNHYDENGKLVGFLTSARDISDRKKTEEKLTESEEKFRGLVDVLPDIIYEADLNMNLTFLNPTGFEKLGYTQQDFDKGLNISQFLSLDEKERAKNNIKTILSGEITPPDEFTLLTKEGGKLRVRIHSRPLYKDNIIAGFRGIISDISRMKKAEEKLRESEEKYRYLLDNIADVVLEIGMKYIISYISPQVRDILGYSVEEIIGTQSFLYVHPDDLNLTAEAINTTIQTGKVEVEFRMLHKDGYYVPVAAKGKRVDMDGKTKLVSVIRDITERKKSEKVLTESEKYLDEIFEFLPVGIGVTDLDGNILGLNQKFTEMFGYTIKDVPTVFDWYPKAYPDINYRNKSIAIWDSDVKKALETGLETPAREYYVTCSDGVVRDVEITMKPGIDKSLVTFVDITERKETEQKLKDSEEKYRLMTEGIKDVIWVMDMNFNFKYISPAIKELRGFTVEEAMNQSMKEMFPPESLNEVTKHIRKEFVPKNIKDKNYNPTWKLELEQYCKDGSTVIVEINMNLIRDDEGKPYEIMGISRDITARKKAEQKIIESEHQYRRAYKQANFYKDLFVHDISNIFNALYGYSQLYSEYQEEMEGLYDQEEMMKNINKHVYRGVNLIRDVQKLSKLDNSIIPTKKVKACEVLKESIENVINSFPQKEIQVDFDYSSKKYYVQANELLLDVFDNILNNAVKYNKNSPVEILIIINKVEVDDEKYVKFEFLDNGIGIMDKLKQYTFKKGYKTEMKSKGMGFGLSIVKKILKSYNGKIWVENKVEGDYTQGSNFVVLIPVSS